jgi:hypothetical protein
MAPRKHPSGSKKRKRKKEVEEFIESQGGAMDKFVRTNTRTSSNEDQPNLAIVVVAEQPNTNEEDHDPTLEENVDINTVGGLLRRRRSSKKKHLRKISTEVTPKLPSRELRHSDAP